MVRALCAWWSDEKRMKIISLSFDIQIQTQTEPKRAEPNRTKENENKFLYSKRLIHTHTTLFDTERRSEVTLYTMHIRAQRTELLQLDYK